MRTIRRFGVNVATDELSSSSSSLLSKKRTYTSPSLSSSSSNFSWTSNMEEERKRQILKLNLKHGDRYHTSAISSLDHNNNNHSTDKENIINRQHRSRWDADHYKPRETSGDKASSNGVIISTNSLTLVNAGNDAYRRRHASVDEASERPVTKSVLKNNCAIANEKSSAGSRLLSAKWSFGSPRRTVSFADDKGLKLTEIRLIDGLAATNDITGWTSTSTSFDLSSITAGRRNSTSLSTNSAGSLSSSNTSASSASAASHSTAGSYDADFVLAPPYRRLRLLRDSDDCHVIMESYTASRWRLNGVIAVKKNQPANNNNNISTTKRVFVRYSIDGWTTSVDKDALIQHAQQSVSTDADIVGEIEQYSFSISFPLRPLPSSRFEIKVGLRQPGGTVPPVTHWDDNNGSNYAFIFM